MNYRMICQVLGRVLLSEAGLLLLPLAVAASYHEPVSAFLFASAAAAVAGLALMRVKPKQTAIYAREGFLCVSLSWLAMSLFGCLPFILSGTIPGFVDALFETVSGFTTTGASVLTDIESLPRGILLWRSFTHWIGGMGVLVFVMAVLPLAGGRAMYIMRVEVPGPTVGKLVPRMRRTAAILYLIYIGLTAAEVVFLLAGGLSLYDAVVHSFATAGTGGFSTYTASIGVFNSSYVEMVVAVFMLLFGVNFNLYFLLLLGRLRDVLRSGELRCYLSIVGFAVLTIALNIRGLYAGIGEALRYSLFQVSSIITTTGFCTADFDLWPEYSRWLLVLLMLIGACAGSTGGGLKVSRVLILFKAAGCEIRRLLHPHSVVQVRMDGRTIDEHIVHDSFVFAAVYIFIALFSTLLLSLDGLDLTTNFTAAVSCLSNIGPGLSLVGASGGYYVFSAPSKLLLTAVMLLGRLEIYPLLMLFAPTVWKNR